MSFHVVFNVVTEFKFIAMHNIYFLAFCVYCLVIPEAPADYFTHQETSLPPKCLQHNRARILLRIAILPLPTPSTSNHLILCHGVFNMAKILLGNAGLTLIIPFPELSLFSSPGLLPQSNDYVEYFQTPSDYSIHEESYISCLWRQNHGDYCWPLFYYPVDHKFFLSHKARLQQSPVPFRVACNPLTNPSNRKYLCLLHDSLS